MFWIILAFIGLGHYIEDPIYHTYDEVLAEIGSFAATYPDLVFVDTIGFSQTDSLPIIAVKISDNAHLTEAEPKVLFNGVHHAEEVLGCEVIMATMRRLLENYPQNDTVRRFVDSLEIWFLPILNPDGHNIVTALIDTGWRKNKRDNNGNGVFDPDSDGVDLNRNYGFNWEDFVGNVDTVPWGYFYRGTAPFSESETQAMQRFCARERFVVSVNYHSPSYSLGEKIYYSWHWPGHTPPFPVDFQVIQETAILMAWQIPRDDGTGSYTAVYGDARVPNARNWMYATYGIISLTPEICSRRVQIPPDEVPIVIEHNQKGIFWLLDHILHTGIGVVVSDTQTGTPLEAEVRVLEIDTFDIYPLHRLTDPRTGAHFRMLRPGDYTLKVEAEGYEPKFVQVHVDDGVMTHIEVKLLRSSPILKPFPNPFRDKVALPLALEHPSKVDLEIFDVTGRKVVSRSYQENSSGLVQLSWDGRDDNGNRVPEGIYFVQLRADGERHVFKVLKL